MLIFIAQAVALPRDSGAEGARRLLANLAGGVHRSYGERERSALSQLLKRSFNDVADSAPLLVGRIGSQFLVLVSRAPVCTFGSSWVDLFWFSSLGKPLRKTALTTGEGSYVDSLRIEKLPASSSPVLQIRLHCLHWPVRSEYFAFKRDRPVLVRFVEDRRLSRVAYYAPNLTFGVAESVPTTRRLRKSLAGGPVDQLNALMWLTGKHWVPGTLRTIRHEKRDDALAFWASTKDPMIVAAVKRLRTAPNPWVSEAARAFDPDEGSRPPEYIR